MGERTNVSMKINGEYIEDLIDGYATLSVAGRESLALNLTTIDKSIEDGAVYRRKRFSGRTLTIGFVIQNGTKSELRSKLDTLYTILNVEEAQFIFDDENSKYYIGTPGSNASATIAMGVATGSFEIFCSDPFKYSTELDSTSNVSGTEIVKTMFPKNTGGYKAYPKFTIIVPPNGTGGDIHRDSECGYFLISKANGYVRSYDSTYTYKKDDKAVYDSYVYKCKADILVAEEFNPEHWDKLYGYDYSVSSIQIGDDSEVQRGEYKFEDHTFASGTMGNWINDTVNTYPEIDIFTKTSAFSNESIYYGFSNNIYNLRETQPTKADSNMYLKTKDAFYSHGFNSKIETDKGLTVETFDNWTAKKAYSKDAIVLYTVPDYQKIKYSVGQIVTYKSAGSSETPKLYKCITAITTIEDFNSDHWEVYYNENAPRGVYKLQASQDVPNTQTSPLASHWTCVGLYNEKPIVSAWVASKEYQSGQNVFYTIPNYSKIKYKKGALAVHRVQNGTQLVDNVYRCTTEITTAEDFNSNHWALYLQNSSSGQYRFRARSKSLAANNTYFNVDPDEGFWDYVGPNDLWYGTTVVYNIADPMAKDFVVSWKQIFTATANTQRGAFRILLLSANDDIIAGYCLDKLSSGNASANAHKYIPSGENGKYFYKLDAVAVGATGVYGYGLTNKKVDYTKPLLKDNKISRTGETITIETGDGKKYTQTSTLKSGNDMLAVAKIVVQFGLYGDATVPPLADNYLYSISLNDNNFDTLNKFQPNDVIVIDCEKMEITKNNSPAADLGDITNDWSNMYLDAGENSIILQWSDFVTNPATILCEWRKRWI